MSRNTKDLIGYCTINNSLSKQLFSFSKCPRFKLI